MSDTRSRIMLWTWDHGPNWFHDIVARICCLFWGHAPERDQCLQPEHDFCIWCYKSMPGKANWRPEDK